MQLPVIESVFSSNFLEIVIIASTTVNGTFERGPDHANWAFMHR